MIGSRKRTNSGHNSALARPMRAAAPSAPAKLSTPTSGTITPHSIRAIAVTTQMTATRSMLGHDRTGQPVAGASSDADDPASW